MIVTLAYGRGGLPVEFPDDRTTVIEPSHVPGLANERAAVVDALERPFAMPPLRECIQPGARVCILFTDITRATPNDRLIPWLLEHLSDVPPDRITLLNQLGTHRPNTVPELEQMLTPEVVRNYRVINHEPENPKELIQVGTLWDGSPALLNRHCVETDFRIVTGFIEPHFFAGFSGGPKGIMPGVAGLRTVMSNHGSRNLSDPNATFGVIDGNPLWEELRDVALRAGPSFLLNVTLNHRRNITGAFAGDLLKAHRAGCGFVRASAMRKCSHAFDLVVTTNSGYPLDMNLYQGVKGMSAAARVVKPGGKVILACECSEGVPTDSRFDNLLRRAKSPEALLSLLSAPGFSEPEQWQAQIQALIQKRASVSLYSSLPDEIVRAAHLEPCADIGQTVADFARQHDGAKIAVLPQGPLTIPYLEG